MGDEIWPMGKFCGGHIGGYKEKGKVDYSLRILVFAAINLGKLTIMD